MTHDHWQPSFKYPEIEGKKFHLFEINDSSKINPPVDKTILAYSNILTKGWVVTYFTEEDHKSFKKINFNNYPFWCELPQI